MSPRLCAWFLLFGFGMLLAVQPASAAHEFPVASLGDIWFQADHAAFREPDGRAVQEFYFRITNNQVRFEESGNDRIMIARVHIKLEFKDDEDRTLGEAERSFEFTVPDEAMGASADHAQILLMRESVDPRTRTVKIQVEDLNSRKRGLLYMVTGKRRNGVAEGILVPPPYAETDAAFTTSDLQMAWSAEAGDGDFEKNGLNVVPNPSRTYGLLQSDVSVYYEVYDHTDAGPGTAYIVDQRVTSPAGEAVYSRTDTVAVKSPDWARVLRFNATDLPAGQYEVFCRIRDFAGTRETEVRRSFGLVWGADAWNRSEADVLDEARILFQEDEFRRFQSMSLADREVYLAEFWNQNNPDPTQRYNPLRQEFLTRVAYANLHYSAFGRKGMVTDRGRIYVRFGSPDEVTSELIPTVDSQLSGLVSQLADGNPGRETLESADAFDTRPYEIWDYTQQGRPLFPDREQTTSRSGLQFVFVDETGTGHYVLRYSSDFINY